MRWKRRRAEARRQRGIADFQEYARNIRAATTAVEVQEAVDAYEKVKAERAGLSHD